MYIYIYTPTYNDADAAGGKAGAATGGVDIDVRNLKYMYVLICRYIPLYI